MHCNITSESHGAQRREASHDRESHLRYLYIVLIVLFTAIVLLFKIQNLQAVTVSLFSASITLPVSILVMGIYVLGALTGGFVFALVRTWVGRVRGGD